MTSKNTNAPPAPQVTPTEISLAADAVRHALQHLGFDTDDENMVNTPMRFVKYLQEYNNSNPLYGPEYVLRQGFSNAKYEGMIVQTNIPFRTICPHHLLPVVGKASVGYVPTDRVVGLSKLTRVVQMVGLEKPRMQEEITDILADMLLNELEALGSMVVITAEHMCMAGRGVAVYEVPTITSSIRGVFKSKPEARSEFFDLCKASHIR